MHRKATQIFYGLSIFVLMTVFFVIHQSNVREVGQWQTDVKQQFFIAWQQTIGDQPIFGSAGLVYDGVTSFYESASTEMISLLWQPDLDKELIYAYSRTYNILAEAVRGGRGLIAVNADQKIPANFMQEEPIYNIVPPNFLAQVSNTQSATVKKTNRGEVAGRTLNEEIPVNNETKQWVTIQDNITGQKYCLAIYNGEVNKYLGPCIYDYH